MNAPDMGAAAHALAGSGLRVFPVHTYRNGKCSCNVAECQPGTPGKSPGKHPRITSWQTHATCHPAKINEWWRKWPDANIGYATGPGSDVWVLDVDGPEGIAALAQLERIHGALPATAEVTTGRGIHRVFLLPADGRTVPNRTGVKPGMDTRGEGGYALAPPSLHPSGKRYEWGEAEDFAEAPEWLLDLVCAPKGRPTVLLPLDGPRPARKAVAGFLGDCGDKPQLSDNFTRTRSALMAIPNNGPKDWEWWNRMGMACWNAFGATEEGRQAFHEWSALNPVYNSAATDERWQHYFNSPPDRIGQGAIEYEARENHGWRFIDGTSDTHAAAPLLPFVSNVKAVDWGEPDLSLLELRRRPPPAFPLALLGPFWAGWVEAGGAASAAPVDYVVLPLFTTASALIGNARWPCVAGGWSEPPHLWIGLVGDSGSSKSPGAACILRDVVPALEDKMRGGFPEQLRAWKAAEAAADAQEAAWKDKLKKAAKSGEPMPAQPATQLQAKPEEPRLVQNDVTIERVATILANAAPKGLLIHRDELAGWFLGMTAYNDSGRQFWLEAYNGGPYRVERQKNPEPINVRRLAVAVIGGVQPERLVQMFADADDGLMARMLWSWPEPLPFRLCEMQPDAAAAIKALDKLRALELGPPSLADLAEARQPVRVLLDRAARPVMEAFGQRMQVEQQSAGGLMRSAYGKARGLALRLSLVLEYLWWCGDGSAPPEPKQISVRAMQAACDLVASYFLPMALRVYGDAALPEAERNAVTLARWIMQTKPKPQEVHLRTLQRDSRLPGLNTAEKIHAAAEILADANWLRRVDAGGRGRPRAVYAVNPALHHAMPASRESE